MKNTRAGNSIVAFLLAIFICSINGDACGGLLESDAGEFELPLSNNYDGDLQCVWIIQLLSRRTVSFTLNRLDSNYSTVSLYPEHEASETVLTPIRLSRSDVGETTETAGQTLVVVFTRSDYTSGLSFTWDSVSSATSDVLTAVNYVDSGEGRALWNRFNRRERLTWALNLPSGSSLKLNAETQFGRCELINPCWCSYFGVYEITNNGYLREVTRVCGRSSTFETEQLHPKLVAFVYINSTVSVAGTDHVELTWASQETATTEPPIDSTTEGYGDVTSLDCGGVIELGDRNPILVGYKHNENETFRNFENCLWTLYSRSSLLRIAVTIEVTLVSDVLEPYYDQVHVLALDVTDGVGTAITSTKLEMQQPQRFYKHGVFLSFTSDFSNTGRGFVLKIQEVDATLSNVFLRDATSYSSLEGRVSYGNPYRNDDRVSVVVNPPNPGDEIIFGVDFIGMEWGSYCNYDRLDIYKIGYRGYFNHSHQLCDQSDSLVGVFLTHEPVLAYFSSDATNANYRGFTISWNATEGSSTENYDTTWRSKEVKV